MKTERGRLKTDNIPKWQTITDCIAAAVGAAVGFLFGEANGLLYALLAFMAIDYVTGVISAAVMHKVSSKAGFVGLAKKLLILSFTAMGHIADNIILGGTPAVMSAVMLFYMANEGISIVENAAALGLPVPKKLKDMLDSLDEE